MSTTYTSYSFALLLPLAAACGGGSQPTSPAKQEAPLAQAPATPTAPAAPKETAQDVYNTRCVPCHGATGTGDGPAAAALTPKPRNYTDAAWQASVTDDQLKKTVLYGGAAVGKSAVMPSQPDLESKPEVLDGLIKLIRAFGSK
jgi:mono/diheme cytochrome c family protein